MVFWMKNILPHTFSLIKFVLPVLLEQINRLKCGRLSAFWVLRTCAGQSFLALLLRGLWGFCVFRTRRIGAILMISGLVPETTITDFMLCPVFLRFSLSVLLQVRKVFLRVAVVQSCVRCLTLKVCVLILVRL